MNATTKSSIKHEAEGDDNTDQDDENYQLGILLNSGVTLLNLLFIIILGLIDGIDAKLGDSLVIPVLESSKYYDLSKKEALDFKVTFLEITNVPIIISSIFLGVLFDLIG